jgi:hypothetical protein
MIIAAGRLGEQLCCSQPRMGFSARTACSTSPASPVKAFCTSSRRPHGAARAADSARAPQLPLMLPLRRRLVPVGWRETYRSPVGAANSGSHGGRGGSDKGTLAAAHIGQLRAGQKPARSANKRTGRRPLSNPPLRPRDDDSFAAGWLCPSGGRRTPGPERPAVARLPARIGWLAVTGLSCAYTWPDARPKHMLR